MCFDPNSIDTRGGHMLIMLVVFVLGLVMLGVFHLDYGKEVAASALSIILYAARDSTKQQ